MQRRRADMLAELGYAALELDMYGSGKLAEHPQDAKKFMTAVVSDYSKVVQRFNYALTLLKNHTTVDNDKTAAIGYCMGGGIVLNMAKLGTELDGVVSFHGSLGPATKSTSGSGSTKMLVLTGADDPFIPQSQVDAFVQKMRLSGVDYQLHSYAGAKHSFTNPEADKFGKQFDLPLAYDKTADQDSWRRMQLFLRQLFE